MDQKPVFLFFFANDSKQTLQLDEEWRKMEQILMQAEKEDRLKYDISPSTKREDLWKKFDHYHQQIACVHYGGHSNEEGLNLKDTVLGKKSLATLLGQEKQLQFVFLNGCANASQLDILFNAGVPAIIATTEAIQDAQAIQLAQQFYSGLCAGRSIKEAFEKAVALVNRASKEALVAYRGIYSRANKTAPFEWGLYAKDEEALNWTLAKKEKWNTNSQLTDNLVPYGERKIPRYLTRLPALETEVIGRGNVLSALWEKLEQSDRAILLNGMGGIGKTTTLIAYAQRFKTRYTHIVWLEQLGAFHNMITTNTLLLKNLAYHPTDDPVTDTQIILNQLTTLKETSLLIIDNVNSEIEVFKDYLPQPPDWHVLLSSRLVLDFAATFPLGFLSQKEALELFYTHYKRSKADALVLQILQTIDFHTLTIELLAKTAQQLKRLKLPEIAESLKQPGLQLKGKTKIRIPHSKDEKVERVLPYLKAIFWLNPEFSAYEHYLLKQFIGLPAIFIPEVQLAEFLNLEEEAYDEFSIGLEQLKEKGWLIHEEDQDAYKMHRIIQSVLLEQLPPTFEDLEVLLKGISAAMYVDHPIDNPLDKFFLVPYGEQLNLLIKEHPDESFATFQNNLAILYTFLGQHNQALALLEKAFESDHANFGDQHPSTVRSQSNLALVYQDFGRYEEAAQLLEKNLAFYKSNSEIDNTALARVQSNLAMVYKDLGQYDMAVDLLEKALQFTQEKWGVNHLKTAITKSHLALVLQELGHLEAASILSEDALTFCRQYFGQSHPNVITLQSNLALIYKDLKQFDKAVALLEQAIAQDQANFGDQHPSTKIRQSNLALVHKDLGHYEESAKILKEVLDFCERHFKTSHPYTSIVQSNLALVYQELGLLEAAAGLLEKALNSDKANFGLKHPSTALKQYNLATTYIQIEQLGEAAALLEQAYSTFIQSFGAQHNYTIMVKKLLEQFK